MFSTSDEIESVGLLFPPPQEIDADRNAGGGMPRHSFSGCRGFRVFVVGLALAVFILSVAMPPWGAASVVHSHSGEHATLRVAVGEAAVRVCV